MPVFTSCKTLNNIRENEPVNLALCKVIRRDEEEVMGSGLAPPFVLFLTREFMKDGALTPQKNETQNLSAFLHFN